ncbi:MAG: hypothetical protein Kow0029_08720 [Candidatus Rifleibacteriota bacterium]
MDYKSIISPIRLLLFLALICLPAAIFAQDTTREWTFMIFMAADNNLESGTSLDINELEKYGSTDKVAFVAQIDRNGNYSNESELKWSGTRRFFVTKDNQPEKMTSKMVEDLGEIDMSTPEALTDFVTWAKENYPAKRYALILWNHGTGWKEIQPDIMAADAPSVELSADMISPGMEAAIDNISYNISYDDTSHDSMDIPTLRETLAEIKEILGQPIDLLGFDACLMQMAEIAWAAAPFASYQIGSPDLEPERGWPYDLIAAGLTKKPAMSPLELGTLIVKTYKQSYDSGSQGNTAVVLSLLDLKQIDNFKEKLNDFCDSIIRNISDIDKIEKCRDEALKYTYGDYIDLCHFLELIRKTSVDSSTKATAYNLYKAIIGEKKKGGLVCRLAFTGEKFAKTRGLSIFFPNRQGFKTYLNRYKRLSFCRDTEWFSALREIATPNIPYMRIDGAILVDANKDGRIAAGEEITLNLSIRNLGRKSLKSATVRCITDSPYLESKSFEVNLTKLPGPQKTDLIPVMKLRVNQNTPVNSEIVLNISLKGKELPLSTISTTFYVKEPFSSTGHALLVLTDGFSPSGSAINEMLNSAGVQYDTWDRVLDGDIKPEVLKRYLDGWVLVVVQDSTPQQSLTEKEIEALSNFLNSGGKLVLDGQDIAFSLRNSRFLSEKCKTSFIQDDVNVHVVSGINGFAGNQTFQIFGGDGANNQKWPDEVDALPGGELIIKYEERARDMADEKEMVGPNHKPNSRTRGIKSSGGAAVKVIDGYRLLFFAFGIEAINNRSQRNSFMKQILAVMQPDITSEMRNLARASSRSARSPLSNRAILEKNDMLSSIESRLLNQIKYEFNKNPMAARKVLREIRSLPDVERQALKKFEKNVESLLEFEKQHGTLNRR